MGKIHYLKSSVVYFGGSKGRCGLIVKTNKTTKQIRNVTCLTCLNSLRSEYYKIYEKYNHKIDMVDIQVEKLASSKVKRKD